MSKIKSQKPDGFTLIEMMVFLFIFTVAVLSLYQAFNLGVNYSIESKKKLQAVELANEKIEQMRNLGYENLTTGATENTQTAKNGITYYITTNITNVDDEADGLGVDGEDDINWDYYRIGVDVKWDLNNSNKQISMNAIVVPPVREEDANKGYMRLHVIDQNGDGLSSAPVTVRDISTNHLVYSGPVNSSGNLFLTGLDPHDHKITVSSGSYNYYPVETMDKTASFNPYDGHASIVAKNLTEKYIQTDKVSDLDVALKDTFGNTISGLGFDIEGGKYLGLENGTTAVYDFSESKSNSDGTESFSDMSFGPYFFDFTDLSDGTNTYQFLWMMPMSDSANKISLDADSNLSAEAILVNQSAPSLLITILDTVDKSPVVSASVKLELASDPLVYSATLPTNDFGKAYFPENIDEIINGEDYNITVTADGYDEETDTVEINNLTTKTIELTST
jgi:type II secretory pathway pseudopilin PulG